MAYADYPFYVNVYGGSAIGAPDFLRLSNLASRYIDVATMGRAKHYTRDDAVKMAMCAIAEVFQDEENLNAAAYSEDALLGGLSRETVGDWSRSYKAVNLSAQDKDLMDKRKRDLLLLWLADTGLLNARGYYAPPRHPVFSRR